jgi:hypothetical protein
MGQVKDATMSPKGYTKTVSAGAVITLTVPAGASRVLLKAETKGFRWRDDGTNPDGTTGMLIDTGDEFWYTGQLRAIRLIEDGASSTATLHASFYA